MVFGINDVLDSKTISQTIYKHTAVCLFLYLEIPIPCNGRSDWINTSWLMITRRICFALIFIRSHPSTTKKSHWPPFVTGYPVMGAGTAF